MAIDQEVWSQLSDGERHLVEWQYNFSGGFNKQLFELIAKADNSNKMRLSMGFPSEVAAFVAYQTEQGWWLGLVKRLGLSD